MQDGQTVSRSHTPLRSIQENEAVHTEQRSHHAERHRRVPSDHSVRVCVIHSYIYICAYISPQE